MRRTGLEDVLELTSITQAFRLALGNGLTSLFQFVRVLCRVFLAWVTQWVGWNNSGVKLSNLFVNTLLKNKHMGRYNHIFPLYTSRNDSFHQ